MEQSLVATKSQKNTTDMQTYHEKQIQQLGLKPATSISPPSHGSFTIETGAKDAVVVKFQYMGQSKKVTLQKGRSGGWMFSTTPGLVDFTPRLQLLGGVEWLGTVSKDWQDKMVEYQQAMSTGSMSIAQPLTEPQKPFFFVHDASVGDEYIHNLLSKDNKKMFKKEKVNYYSLRRSTSDPTGVVLAISHFSEPVHIDHFLIRYADRAKKYHGVVRGKQFVAPTWMECVANMLHFLSVSDERRYIPAKLITQTK